MSSSRSDGVTKFVRLSVRPFLFFPLVSLKSVLHLDVSRKFQGCFKKVSGCFKEVLRVF